MDPYEFLQITANPDGSLIRHKSLPNIQPTGYSNDSSQTVATIDIPLNTTNNTWIRVFHPLNLASHTKLPIIIYFHPAGFVLCSAASVPFHESCLGMATDLPAIILSVEHRLAPEHRLPSAYEDAIDAMLWLKTQALDGGQEHKFANFVDFTKCFLMGVSSGGNIAYHAGLRALALDLKPVKINGLILSIPFFGGQQRSDSELKYVNDAILPLPVADLMWELSLPTGANRDHEYCNPMVGMANCSEIIQKLPRCYINGYGGDPLVDRQMEFVKMLEDHGVPVVSRFVEDGYHGVEMFDPEKAQATVMGVKNFIYSSAGSIGDDK